MFTNSASHFAPHGTPPAARSLLEDAEIMVGEAPLVYGAPSSVVGIVL